MNKILKIFAAISFIAILAGCQNDDYVNLSSEKSVSQSIEGTENNQTSSKEWDKTSEIVVYVSGAVKKPGVYRLCTGDRIYQAIESAGGMTSKAKKDCLNLADFLEDAQKIYVMSKREYKNSDTSEIQESNGDNENKGAFVNINTAGKEQLVTLPGIGETKAAAIIAYREENGSFLNVEDIKKVSGIGDATFSNIQSLITIK